MRYTQRMEDKRSTAEVSRVTLKEIVSTGLADTAHGSDWIIALPSEGEPRRFHGNPQIEGGSLVLYDERQRLVEAFGVGCWSSLTKA